MAPLLTVQDLHKVHLTWQMVHFPGIEKQTKMSNFFLKYLLYLLHLRYNLTNKLVLDKSAECTRDLLANMSLPMQ